MSFTAIADADDLGTVLEAAHAIVDECKLRVDDHGLSITAVDPANVAMIDLHGTHQLIESLDASESMTLGVDLGRLLDAIGLFDGIVDIECDDHGDRVHVTDGRLEATVATIDTDSIRDEPDLPDLDLAGDVLLEAGELATVIKAASVVAPEEWITFTAHDGGVRFEAAGDLDDITLDLEAGIDESILEYDAPDGEHVTMIDLGYLEDIAKPLPSDVKTRIRWGDEFPLKVHYVIGDGIATVEYMIAPRIEAD